VSITFDHVNIVTDDLEGTMEFFVNTFGFTAGTPTTLEGPWVDELNGYTNCKATYVPLAPPPIGSPPAPARPGTARARGQLSTAQLSGAAAADS